MTTLAEMAEADSGLKGLRQEVKVRLGFRWSQSLRPGAWGINSHVRLAQVFAKEITLTQATQRTEPSRRQHAQAYILSIQTLVPAAFLVASGIAALALGMKSLLDLVYKSFSAEAEV